MRYYKRLNRKRYVYATLLVLGIIFLSLIFSRTGLDSGIILFLCGVLCLTGGWVIRKGRHHYLEIDDEMIIHRGFRNWTIRKSDVTQVVQGRKGWLDDNELYLRIVVDKKEFVVDDGFLTDEEHVQELAEVIGSR